MGRWRPPDEGMTENLASCSRTLSLDTEVLELRGHNPIRQLVPYRSLFTLRIKPDADMKTRRRPRSHDAPPFGRPGLLHGERASQVDR